MFVPPNSYVEILTIHVMVLGCEVTGRYLGHESVTLMNTISVLTQGLTEIPCHFYHFTLMKLARKLKG